MMNKIIKERLALIQSGTIPHGYKKTKAGIMPEDWDGAVRAKDVFKNYTDKKHNGDLEILAATQENGIVPRSQIGIDIQCSEEGVNGYKKVSKGDFVISLRSFQGGIEYSEYDGIVSPAYTVLQPVREISDGYYRNYFKTDSFIQRLNGAVYGIRDGKQIGYQDFGDMCIYYPPIDEQKKIAEVLSCCDRVIELKQQLIAELQRLKSGFLQAMFPAKGHREPDIRFPEFSDAWEQRKFSDFTWDAGKRNKDNLDLVPYAITNEHGFIPQNEAHDEFGYMKDTDRRAYNIVEPKSFAYNPARINVGSLGYYEGSENVIVSSLYEVFKTAEYVDDRFLWHWLKSPELPKWIGKLQEGSVRLYFYYDKLCECILRMPSIDEQRKIAKYLDNLDHLITLHQRELEETKKKKKSLAKLLLTGSVRVPT